MRRVTFGLVLLSLAATACGGSEDGAVKVAAMTDVVTATVATTATAAAAPTDGGATAPAVETAVETVIETVASTAAALPATTAAEAASVSYEVWLQRGEQLWPVTRRGLAVPGVGAAAIESLLAGPTASEGADGVGTVVPSATRLLGLDIADGTATVDLSAEYASGGGSLSMTVRLAQVVYTLTQFDTVERVAFRLDGEPVRVFSGEGLTLDRPQTRADYEAVLPVIAVTTPGDGEELRSPVRIAGLANVFEANVTVEILGENGEQLAQTFTTASCGTGCWGDFAADVAFAVDQRQPGTIVVHDDDAEGSGVFPHERRIPVTLLP